MRISSSISTWKRGNVYLRRTRGTEENANYSQEHGWERPETQTLSLLCVTVRDGVCMRVIVCERVRMCVSKSDRT